MGRSERKQKRTKFIFGLVIVGLMVFGVFGIALSFSQGTGSGSQTLEYKGIKFKSTPQGYAAKINDKKSVFTNYPGNLELIEIPSSIIPRLQNTKMIYVTSDPDSPVFKDIGLAQFYLQTELEFHLNIYVVVSLNKNSSFQLPIITCEDATPAVPVLEFRYANSTQILEEDNCIIIEAPTQYGFLQAKDRILFTMLGVMQ